MVLPVPGGPVSKTPATFKKIYVYKQVLKYEQKKS